MNQNQTPPNNHNTKLSFLPTRSKMLLQKCTNRNLFQTPQCLSNSIYDNLQDSINKFSDFSTPINKKIPKKSQRFITHNHFLERLKQTEEVLHSREDDLLLAAKIGQNLLERSHILESVLIEKKELISQYNSQNEKKKIKFQKMKKQINENATRIKMLCIQNKKLIKQKKLLEEMQSETSQELIALEKRHKLLCYQQKLLEKKQINQKLFTDLDPNLQDENENIGEEINPNNAYEIIKKLQLQLSLRDERIYELESKIKDLQLKNKSVLEEKEKLQVFESHVGQLEQEMEKQQYDNNLKIKSYQKRINKQNEKMNLMNKIQKNSQDTILRYENQFLNFENNLKSNLGLIQEQRQQIIQLQNQLFEMKTNQTNSPNSPNSSNLFTEIINQFNSNNLTPQTPKIDDPFQLTKKQKSKKMQTKRNLQSKLEKHLDSKTKSNENVNSETNIKEEIELESQMDNTFKNGTNQDLDLDLELGLEFVQLPEREQEFETKTETETETETETKTETEIETVLETETETEFTEKTKITTHNNDLLKFEKIKLNNEDQLQQPLKENKINRNMNTKKLINESQLKIKDDNNKNIVATQLNIKTKSNLKKKIENAKDEENCIGNNKENINENKNKSITKKKLRKNLLKKFENQNYLNGFKNLSNFIKKLSLDQSQLKTFYELLLTIFTTNIKEINQETTMKKKLNNQNNSQRLNPENDFKIIINKTNNRLDKISKELLIFSNILLNNNNTNNNNNNNDLDDDELTNKKNSKTDSCILTDFILEYIKITKDLHQTTEHIYQPLFEKLKNLNNRITPKNRKKILSDKN
ncbi:hypothetical protein M0813_21954 [Anaeramoeba flamelloides]|uniref:Uncharacterized protein n=1 Tax=Anaeramoeba flamelloides TaxID=1746091 RepID=A0ABQ8YFZ1_9EUKA|nr:hypothetical protein M0813_21954 [Anaeramoeba flamelloides]